MLATIGATTMGALAGCQSGSDDTEMSDRTDEQVSTETDSGSTESSATGSRMYRVDAANSGHLSETRGPQERPVKKWHESKTTIHFITPAVIDGTVHVGPELAASDGTVSWDGDFYERSPAVIDGRRYSVTFTELNTVSLDDTLNEWNYYFTTNPSAPTVVDEVAYLGYERGQLYALTTPGESEEGFQVEGEAVWSFQQPDDPESGLETGAFYAPAVVGDTVYASSPTHLYALSATDGRQKWVQTDVTGGVPAVVGGTVYLPTGESIVARSATDGSKEWESRVGSPHPVAVADGVVYANHHKLHAIDTTDGSVLWETELPGAASTPDGFPTPGDMPSEIGSFNFSAPPVVANGTVYATNGGTITALAAGTGAIQWSYETSGTGAWTPAIADGDLYVVVSYASPTDSDNFGDILALTEP
ncbi:MAG: PQQ-binding-like beta-propeller repeat protein [Natronomonas sp.]|uniref:PQQ-binding-like beta-propeller repeat protein n=1 Tax=Natronomonas sp. TaxID=2184060 RepID=UPI0028708ABB|nr:PQQ-binding-like beta-propeller repeat protein [Natronomonas sp.]MDR9430168.1 PQQ-binding-like beta-propeller repeat protein [Natronomonas sp.]